MLNKKLQTDHFNEMISTSQAYGKAAKGSIKAMARVSGCSYIDISESHKLDNEGDDEFIGREEQKPGGLHFGVATY
ncbi:hypothetical protein Tco_0362660 [Tanacetum coccineum]